MSTPRTFTQADLDALPDTLELPLRRPIELGSITYDKLTFREPTAGQIETVSDIAGIPGENALLALSAGVVIDVIRRLPARELKRATTFLYSFTQDVDPTGEPG